MQCYMYKRGSFNKELPKPCKDMKQKRVMQRYGLAANS